MLCKSCQKERELNYCNECYQSLFSQTIQKIFESSSYDKINFELRELRDSINSLIDNFQRLYPKAKLSKSFGDISF